MTLIFTVSPAHTVPLVQVKSMTNSTYIVWLHFLPEYIMTPTIVNKTLSAIMTTSIRTEQNLASIGLFMLHSHTHCETNM